MRQNLFRATMSTRVIFGSFCVCAVLLVMFTIMMTKRTELPDDFARLLSPYQRNQEAVVDSHVLVSQRNDLSKKLNEMKKRYGQASCEMMEMKQKTSGGNAVSENGGWCSKLSGSDSSAHRFDEGFAKALSKFLTSKHVGSFGDGPGDYKKALDSWKQVASYKAYDGAPFCETTTQGTVHFLDLTGPQFGLGAFDWVMSVEVGEHIPAMYEDIYLDNLARHAKEGIILSWAVPGQDGLSHVNNQPLSHVINQLKKRGFSIDKEAGQPIRDAAAFGWLRRNVHVYRRDNLTSFNMDDV